MYLPCISDGALKAARLMELCDAYELPPPLHLLRACIRLPMYLPLYLPGQDPTGGARAPSPPAGDGSSPGGAGGEGGAPERHRQQASFLPRPLDVGRWVSLPPQRAAQPQARRCAEIPRFVSLRLPSSHFISHHLLSSPCISLHLPASPSISLHLPSSPFISLHLPASPCISLHLPSSPVISLVSGTAQC